MRRKKWRVVVGVFGITLAAVVVAGCTVTARDVVVAVIVPAGGEAVALSALGKLGLSSKLPEAIPSPAPASPD